jgi:hypothetical protein
MRTLASPIGVLASSSGASNWPCCCGSAPCQQTTRFTYHAPARLARPSNVQRRSRAAQRASVMRLSLTGASFGRARLNSIDLLAAQGRSISFAMLAVPVLLFVWAKAEAHLHDTTEAQQLLSTYMVAASGAVSLITSTALQHKKLNALIPSAISGDKQPVLITIRMSCYLY